MSSDYVNKKKDNFVKIIDSSNDFEMLSLRKSTILDWLDACEQEVA